MLHALPAQMAKQVWLCRGKNAHTIIVKTRCTAKLLLGEMCQSLIDQMIMKNIVAFDIPVSCVYMLAIGVP